MADKPNPRSIVRVELDAKDSNKVKVAYRDLFGWKSQDFAGFHTSSFQVSSGTGGCIRSPDRDESRGTPNSILVRSIPFGPPAAIV
jgi:predicted enzyme related to lactoylglutathione lyase